MGLRGAGWSPASSACCCGTRACSASSPRTTGPTPRRRAAQGGEALGSLGDALHDRRYRYAQFEAVFDLMESQQGSMGGPAVCAGAADVDTRALERNGRAFEDRCAS